MAFLSGCVDEATKRNVEVSFVHIRSVRRSQVFTYGQISYPAGETTCLYILQDESEVNPPTRKEVSYIHRRLKHLARKRVRYVKA